MTNAKRIRVNQHKVKRKSTRRRRLHCATLPWVIHSVVALLGGLILFSIVRPRPGILMSDLGNLHILPPAKAVYNSYPPTSGSHYDGLAPWGIHNTPVPNELQVHNLEDGGVMVQYDCPVGCDELVSQLTKVVERYDHDVILAPYPDMESRIVLTAWNRLETFEEFNEARIIRFINEYHGQDHHQ